MANSRRMYWLHALSSLHVGSGQGEGYIDLPITREKVTRFPYVPGSSVKGVLADFDKATEEKREVNPLVRARFGRTGEEHANAGSLIFTDARLICLPVQSLFGTVAWCTSRFVLRRLLRDLEFVGYPNAPGLPSEFPDDDQGNIVVNVPDSPPSALQSRDRIYLADLDLTPRACEPTQQWAERLAKWTFPGARGTVDPWRKVFLERFVVLPDDLFNALTETATEVQPHVRIDDEMKCVVKGQLWYEESLPAETILAGLVWCDRVFVEKLSQEQVMETCQGEKTLQFGGKATVGKGLTRCVFPDMNGQQPSTTPSEEGPSDAHA